MAFLISDPTVARPDLLGEGHWDGVIPQALPYTKASQTFKKKEYQGSAEVHLKVKESDKIYSDMSLYGSLKARIADAESEDGNYETISTTIRNIKRRNRNPPSPLVTMELGDVRPPPPPPNKNSFSVTATIESQGDVSSLYSSPRRVNFILGRSGAFNEDEEVFEDICHPDDDPLKSIDTCRDQQQLIETHFV